MVQWVLGDDFSDSFGLFSCFLWCSVCPFHKQGGCKVGAEIGQKISEDNLTRMGMRSMFLFLSKLWLLLKMCFQPQMESFGQNYILTGDSKPEPIVDGSKTVSLGVSNPILICNFSSELFQSYSSLWERSAWINKGLNWQSKKRWGLATMWAQAGSRWYFIPVQKICLKIPSRRIVATLVRVTVLLCILKQFNRQDRFGGKDLCRVHSCLWSHCLERFSQLCSTSAWQSAWVSDGICHAMLKILLCAKINTLYPYRAKSFIKILT